jgi:hypothetical protein
MVPLVLTKKINKTKLSFNQRFIICNVRKLPQFITENKLQDVARLNRMPMDAQVPPS